jgi:hypothetical protein
MIVPAIYRNTQIMPHQPQRAKIKDIAFFLLGNHPRERTQHSQHDKSFKSIKIKAVNNTA